MASGVYVVGELLLILVAECQMPAIRIFLMLSVNRRSIVRPSPIEDIISNLSGRGLHHKNIQPTDQKTTAAKAVACLVLVGDQCRPEVARPGWAR